MDQEKEANPYIGTVCYAQGEDPNNINVVFTKSVVEQLTAESYNKGFGRGALIMGGISIANIIIGGIIIARTYNNDTKKFGKKSKKFIKFQR